MSDIKEAKVPDIGDYDGVPVIEILVAVGDTVKKDQGLVTLESDKATMEVPSAFAGVVKEIKVKLGDEIAEGAVVALIEVSEGAAEAKAACSRWSTASRRASVEASRAISLAASVWVPSLGLRDSGAISSTIDCDPAAIAPSSPKAVPPRMPPEPEVLSDTLAGAK